MTREDIIKLAREAGLQVADNYDYRGSFEKLTLPEREEFLKMLRFAALVAAAEREACAKVCEARGPDGAERFGLTGALVALDCAERIRARGE